MLHDIQTTDWFLESNDPGHITESEDEHQERDHPTKPAQQLRLPLVQLGQGPSSLNKKYLTVRNPLVVTNLEANTRLDRRKLGEMIDPEDRDHVEDHPDQVEEDTGAEADQEDLFGHTLRSAMYKIDKIYMKLNLRIS